MLVRMASIIDYPKKGLDPDIWIGTGDNTKLQSKIEEEILDIIHSALDDLDLSHDSVLEMYIYGSILTNLWNPHTDIDCRIILDPDVIYEKFGQDITGDDIFDMLIEQVHGIDIGDTDHPFNATIIIKDEDTELSRATLFKGEEYPIYDVLNRKMLVPPVIYEDYDPDEKFVEEKEETDLIMEKLDALLRETKKDAIDYEWLKDAIEYVKEPEKLMNKLEGKLEEIENDLNLLAEEYESIKDERTESYAEGKDHDSPANVKHKLLEKYFYLDTLRKLKRILKGGVQENEIEEIEEAIGIKKTSQYPEFDILPPDGPIINTCPWCGYANEYSPGKIRKKKRCSKCGRILTHLPGGEYSEWSLDGNVVKAGIFDRGITEESVHQFNQFMKENALPDEQVKNISKMLEEAIVETEKRKTEGIESDKQIFQKELEKTLEPLKKIV